MLYMPELKPKYYLFPVLSLPVEERIIMSYKSLIESLGGNARKEIGITVINKEREIKFITYHELLSTAREYLHGLNEINICAGDHLIFQIMDIEKYIYTIWACFLGKIIAAPLPIALNSEQAIRVSMIAETLNNCHIITDIMPSDQKRNIIKIDMLSKNEEADILSAKPDDIAMIQYSSGSTGDPKGVLLTHENLITTIEDISEIVRLKKEDLIFSWMPITHDFGLIAFHILPIYNGCNQYQMSTQLFLNDPMAWLGYLDKYRITITASPNFGLKHVMKHGNLAAFPDMDLSCIRIICNGAEPISYDACESFCKMLSVYNLNDKVILPVYGLAEAGLAVTIPHKSEGVIPVNIDRSNLAVGQKVIIVSNELESGDALKLVKVGAPVKNCGLRICDSNDEEVGELIIGHIQIKGKNVTSGYYKNDSLTDALFTNDGWLKTGDIGFMYQGQLVITGRVKDVIFSNGQNYYTFDIERCINTIQEYTITETAVTSVCGEGVSELVVAFIKYNDNISDFIDIARHIKQYAIKNIGIILDHVLPVNNIPKTSSGKIMRYELKRMFEDREFDELINCMEAGEKQSGFTYETDDMNSTERMLENLWKEALSKNTFDRRLSYIENGGDSIKSAIICNEVKSRFNVDISVRDLFAGMTFDDMYIRIKNGDRGEAKRIKHAGICEHYPLSYEQERIYTASLLGKNKVYNICCAIKVKGEFQKDIFEAAFIQIIKRHEILRTSFHLADGVPYQKIHDEFKFEIKVINSIGSIEDEINTNIEVFDLSVAPLVCVIALMINSEETILLLNMHHIISDGTSIGIIIDELKNYYADKELSNLEYQYRDYVIWQQKEWGGILKKEEKYWMNVFKTAPTVLNMPLDFERPSRLTYVGRKHEFDINPHITTGIRKVMEETQASLFSILFSAYCVLLQRYTGQEDITVGTTMAGRDNFEFSKNIGMYVNLLPIRTYPMTNKEFMVLLNEVKDCIVSGYSNQKYPITMLSKKLRLDTKKNRYPLFDTVFQLRNFYLPAFDNENMGFEEYSFDNKVSMFDFKIEAVECQDDIHFNLEYSTELFRSETMKRFSERYVDVVNQIVNNPTILIDNIEIMNAEEKQILEEFRNKTESAIDFNFI